MPLSTILQSFWAIATEFLELISYERNAQLRPCPNLLATLLKKHEVTQLFLQVKRGKDMTEPRHEKICLRGFRQVTLKPAYAATEAS